MTSTNCASVGSSLSLGAIPLYRGPAGSRPAAQSHGHRLAPGCPSVGGRTAGGGLTCDSSQSAIKHLSHKARDVRSQAHSYHVYGVKGSSINLRYKSTHGHVFSENVKKIRRRNVTSPSVPCCRYFPFDHPKEQAAFLFEAYALESCDENSSGNGGGPQE